MRLTALCVCGILLAFWSFSWTSADFAEDDLLGDKDFGPCAATLQLEGSCRQGQDGSNCPYLFSLPPLTVHLPKQLRELEKIMKDLQNLKDNVDQLRKMCADCAVSQTEKECGRQRERENVKLNESMGGHGDENNWMNGRNPERLKDFKQECVTDGVKVEKTSDGDVDTHSEKRAIFDERGKKKWEAERESDKRVVKENEKAETPKKVAEKDGKSQTEGAKGRDKVGLPKVPTAGGNKRIEDIAREKVVEKNNKEKETERNKEKGVSKGGRDKKLEGVTERQITTNIKKEKTEESYQHVWHDETDRKTQTEADRGSDEIKMSEDHDEHTNKEREQHSEERKKKTEKGNNEKSKQTESIGHAEQDRTVKEGEVEEVDRETGGEIKTEGEKVVQSVQRDSNGELTSSKAVENTNFASVSPTPETTVESIKATTFTSSLPSPPLSGSHFITDVDQRMTIAADERTTHSTDSEISSVSENTHPDDADAGFSRTTRRPTVTDTQSTLGGSAQQIKTTTTKYTITTSLKPLDVVQGQISSTAATTTITAPRQNLNTTTFPAVTDRSRWTAKNNISSNTKIPVKPLPGRGAKPGEKHKPGSKPEVKNPKIDRKPPLPDKKTKQDQKQKFPHQKPTTDYKPKPGKAQIPKPDQRVPFNNFTTGQNQKNNTTPKQDQDHNDQNKLTVQKPKPYHKPTPPVQRPPSHQRPATVKDPVTETETESVDTTIIDQNSKPEKKPHQTFENEKPDPKQKPENKSRNEEETKPDQSFEPNQRFTSHQEPESEQRETTSVTTKPIPTEITGNSDENPSSEPKSNQDSTPGQKLTPDQRPEPSQKIPTIKQNPKPGHNPKIYPKNPKLETGEKTKPNVKPKPSQVSPTNQGLKMPESGLMPNLKPKSKLEAEFNKTSKPKLPPILRPPTGRTVKPEATSVRRPKPAVHLKPSPKTRTDLNPVHVSGTTSDGIQNSQSDMPPTSGPIKQAAEVTQPQGATEFSPSMKKTITPGPKISNSLNTGPSPLIHTLPEGFTMSPRSRITSDLKPQAAGQPSPIPTTTRPNTIITGILPSVITSTSPGSTKLNPASNPDSILQINRLHNVKETAPRQPNQTPDPDNMMRPVPSSNAQTTSTLRPDLTTTTSTTSGPQALAAELSTPSARELRVKINQVAAFLNNNPSPNGKPLDKEQPEGEGGSRPDRKLPTRIPPKVSMAKRDCSDHLLRGETKSRVYLVTPDFRSKSFPVLCDMEVGGGGWTVLQRRHDGSVSFNRTWAEYRSGFGKLDGGEFWLGNNMIYLLTRDRDMVLRVELEDFNGVSEYAEYEHFRVASERQRYKLSVGGYSGTAGDALRFDKSYDHNNRPFTTPDRDNDRYPSGNCGAYYSSGWWFDACMAANLNGRYYVGQYTGVRDGIFWGTWHNISTEYYPTNVRRSFKTVRMMIRPKGFAP